VKTPGEQDESVPAASDVGDPAVGTRAKRASQ
jgi:hypothetical protein